MTKSVVLIGTPVQTGTHQPGCIMGPDALRTAGLEQALRDLGHSVEDHGNMEIPSVAPVSHMNENIHHLSETCQWTKAIQQKALEVMRAGKVPIFLGGDHSIAAGSVSGITAAAHEADQEQFVLWLDAHPDFHVLSSTESGNLHGTPVAYYTSQEGFEDYFPPLPAKVNPQNICMMGLRSVDGAERIRLAEQKVSAYDMRALDENGVAKPLKAFLDRVKEANGRLHVSFDVDFLEPDIAPAVGTTVPGGATFREAHLIMEMLHDSKLVTSLDLVELNPFLDERGRTATLMVDLAASLFGKNVLDRPNRPYANW
ncbi:arginase [Flexibacterium corallicola]|uniref:arginase n=1 Tax=Flexibacterium corallicola TaxID=3037259 RepID=UPI00286F3833|nr:arginase [Pseudovibrio sp. M1P-2-3]